MIAAVMTMALQSQARPDIDPLLEPYFSGIETNEMVTVIAQMQDVQYIPYLSNSVWTYYDMRYALEQNARQAQSRVYNALKSGAESNNIPIKIESNWLANVMIIELPGSMVKYLANFNEFVALIADRPMEIVMPWDNGLIEPWMSLEANDYTYGLKKLQMPTLNEKMPNLNGEGVNVGIIDTGIEPDHPDLLGRTIAFRDFVGSGQQAYDDQGHGTHVAGTIAGGFASGTQIGVAPKVKLTIAKVFDRRGGGTLSGILKSMEWIADPDGNPQTADAPALVSNSWGGGPSRSSQRPEQVPLCKAVMNWVKLGIFPVFAAGNSGSRSSTVGLPGGCPDAFAVGATDSGDNIARFSSRGPAQWATGNIVKPEISAPGVNVTSSFIGKRWRSLSGTSMATPHVAGLAALVYQAAPGADISTVAEALIRGVDDLGTDGQDNTFGWGRANALKTMAPALQ